MNNRVKGPFLVLLAYVIWGILPIFWALLADVYPLVVLHQRVLWSMVLLGLLLLLQGKLLPALRNLNNPHTCRSLVASACLLGLNWLTYIWAISTGEYVAASMGYFLCPLLTILSGSVLFRERLSRAELLALGCIAPGIAIPILLNGEFPWIALLLAGSWSGYTSLRKRMQVGAVEGVFLETVLLIVPLTFLSLIEFNLTEVLSYGELPTKVFLFIAAGFVTAVPQIMLVAGVKNTTLKFVGVTQYLAPTLMLCVSMIYFGKTPSQAEYLTLAFVWVGITVFFCGSRLAFPSLRLFPKAIPRADLNL